MWLLNDGWSSKMENIKGSSVAESTIFVGPVKNPISFIKRKEIEDYLDDTFFKGYNIWQKWHMGFGLPFSGTWFDMPKHIIDVIEWYEIVHKKLENENRK